VATNSAILPQIDSVANDHSLYTTATSFFCGEETDFQEDLYPTLICDNQDTPDIWQPFLSVEAWIT
jgi:hypothetical protein